MWRLQILERMEHYGRAPPLWNGGGDAEDKGKEREKSDVPLCPVSDNSSPSNQNIPAGVLGTAEEGILQMEVMAGCWSLDPAAVPRVQQPPQEGLGPQLSADRR